MSQAHRIDIAATHTILLQPARHAWSPGRPLKELGRLPADLDPQVHALTEYAQAWVAFTGGRYGAAMALAQASEAAVGLNRHGARSRPTACGYATPASLPACWTHCGPNRSRVVATAFGLRTLEAGAAALSGEARPKAQYRARSPAGIDLPLAPALRARRAQTFRRARRRQVGMQAAQLAERLGAKGPKRLAGTGRLGVRL